VVRFAVSLASLPATSVDLAAVVPASGSVAWFLYDSGTGRFGVRWGSGSVTTATVAPAAGTWYLIELKADFASPHTLTWRIDGADQTTASVAEAATTAISLGFGTTATNVAYTANFDDIIASRTSTAYPIGNGKVLALAPNGTGTTKDPARFQEDDGTAVDASTWNRIDDVPADSTADYVKQISNGTGSYAEFTLQDTAETCVQAVSALLAYHSAAGTTNTGKASVFAGAEENVIYSGDMTGLANPLGYKRAIVSPPSGGWTTAAVNALFIRLGYSGDSAPNPYWDALLVEYDVPTA
jgi:hypothetical protein